MGTFTLSRSFMRVANLFIQISRFASVLTLYFLVLFNYASFVLLQNRVGSKFGGGGVAGASETNVDRRERLRKIAMGVVDLNKVRPRTCHSSPKPHSLHHPNLKIEKKKTPIFVCMHLGPIYSAQPPRIARMPSMPNTAHERRLLPSAHARQKTPDEPRAARSARYERG
jgi:hypothetical protein